MSLPGILKLNISNIKFVTVLPEDSLSCIPTSMNSTSNLIQVKNLKEKILHIQSYPQYLINHPFISVFHLTCL